MTRNVRMLSHEIPLMQIARKARFEAMEKTARSEERRSMDMLVMLSVLGIVITACLLAAAYTEGWW